MGTLILDHLGIVSATAHNLGLVQKIDARLPRYDVRRIVSSGQAVLAMILNGLGFSNHRLYLVPDFLANKPVDRLIAPNMKPEYFDDHVLGRALDEIAEYGASRFFHRDCFRDRYGTKPFWASLPISTQRHFLLKEAIRMRSLARYMFAMVIRRISVLT